MHLNLQPDFEGHLALLSLISKIMKRWEVLVYDVIGEDLTPGDLCQMLLKSKQGRKAGMVCCTKMVTLC